MRTSANAFCSRGSGSSAAVGTLLRIMTDREATPASRVRAADVVLQTTLRGMDAQLEVAAQESLRHRG